MKKAISALLVLVMLCGMLPATARAEEATQSPWSGKTVSILSASTSTYVGVSNNTAANSTIGNNDVYYTEGRHGVYQKDMWWQQVLDVLGMELLVNNAWSGSCVFQPRKGEASVGYGSRAVNLHNDRTGEEPDIIWVYLGSNDFAYYQDTFGKAADVDYSALIQDNGDGTFAYVAPTTTCEAYAIMLHKIKTRYPDAEIYCMPALARRDPDYAEDNRPDPGQPTAFNAELIAVAEHLGCTVIDWESCIPKEAELFDLYIGDKRAHPNAAGMDLMSQAVISGMLGREIKLYDVSGTYTNVYTDNKAAAAMEGSAYQATLSADSSSGMNVTVTMGGADVTSSAYADGKIHIETVTGDIEITAAASRAPMEFRWEVVDGKLTSTGKNGNVLTALSESITDGVIREGQYQLETSVVLKHDQPWVVEWKCGGDWRGLLLSTTSSSQTNGRQYLARTKGGQLCFGQRSGSQSNNYGVDLSTLDAQPHTYRLENRIAADGSNMVWLYLDGVEVSPMNNYFIASKDQGTTSEWINGKDFVFPYIGMDSTPLTNCQLNYLSIQEGGHTHTYKNGTCTACGQKELAQPLSLRYDDHYDVTGKTVEIIDAGKPTSYQVGYGVEENAVPDTAVVTLEGDTLVATGIGTARVTIDGQLYEVTVTAAPISLLLLAGQSNMQGSEGDANQSIICEDGMVYSTYGDRYTMTASNATDFAPSALTGTGSSLNVNGTAKNLEDWPVYLLNEAGAGKAGPDSGYAYEWVKQTGEKVWIVNAAHGGTSIKEWQDGATQYEECVSLFKACQETLRKEIAAGHFTLSHMGYFWCQGCADETQTAEWYVQKYLAMHNSLKQELAADLDGDGAAEELEFSNITVTLAGHVNKTGYRYEDGLYNAADSTFFTTYEELEMRGQRVAQYWLAANPDYPEIHMVCNIGESWVAMPDGTDGVAEYFAAHYGNGTVDYTPQVTQKASWYTPTTAAAVKDSIHYNQIGYNEVGREAARNTLILLGEIPDTGEATTVRFVDWTGYREVASVTASEMAYSGTLAVPVVSPCYRSKDVSYQLSNGLRYEYYDLLASSGQAAGTLTAVGASGTVEVTQGHLWSEWTAVTEPSADGPGTEARTCADCGKTETREVNGVWQTLKLSDHLSALPEAYCSATNLWTALEHDAYFFNGTSSWNKHASGTVYSVTIPVSPGDRIFATSFGAYPDNGGSKNGIRCTFFNAEGVAKTYSPADTYDAYIANGGYLIAPEGAIAVNIPMWNNSDDNELYILTRYHTYENGTCTACGEAHTNLANYKGKVISVLGDSISTFAGYIPVADGFNLEHLARYPQEDLLTDVNETWWMQVIAELDAKLGINDSWRGATCSGYHAVTTGTTGENAAMHNLTRIQNLGSNGTPDVILFYGGTNDLAHVAKVGTFDPATAPSAVDLTTKKWDNLADGYVHTLLRLKHFYPDAQIVCLLPTYTASYYSDAKLAQGNEVLSAICAHYGVPYVDLRDCGITTANLPDGIHPDAKGMDHITDAVLELLLAECELESGEHTVHSITHKLTDAESSKAYCKGVSHGHVFTATITGENVTVTVTMGGADITSGCYADGTVHIPEVTGDIVITAKGQKKAVHADYLLPLPDSFCEKTDLWEVLEHNKAYYTASGWGIHSSGKVFSVTIPVTPGDRIHATSFGKSGANGGTIDGIRVTWFAETDVLKSVSAESVYAEFSANGYLTAPEGAIAVNIPMWNNSDDNELYILNRDHSFGDWTESKAPSCTEKGEARRGCAICGHSESRELPALGHTEVTDKAVAASCTGSGLTEGRHCAVCEAVLVKQETVPATGHSFGDWTEAKAPACTEKGEARRGCAICGHSESRELPALGHTEVTDKAVAASCTGSGLTEGMHCAVCEAVLVKPETVPATGHSFGDWTESKAPSCTEKGEARRGCAICGHSESRELPALGHTEVTDKALAASCTGSGLTEGTHCGTCKTVLVKQETVPATGHSYESVVTQPTCTETGFTTHTCSACGDRYADGETTALGHRWDGGSVTREPTEQNEGENTYTCTVCGKTRTETIPMLEHVHRYASVVTAPTYTDRGFTTHTCSGCGHSYADAWTDPLPARSGDFNLDGTVNDADVAYLLWHTLFPEKYPIIPTGDLNGDGAVTDLDVAYLLWHTLFPEHYPL